MLGIKTRKKILYLDQNFLSTAFRKDPKWNGPLRRMEELLDLQLLAVPYSPTHEKESRFWVTNSDALLKFIRTLSRGHKFEPYYYVERVQILKAFQAFLESAPATCATEEHDALPSSVHDWDGRFSRSVERQVSEFEVKRERRFKLQAVDELVQILADWAASNNSFEQDMKIEVRDAARILLKNYEKKTARIWAGDFSALLDSPVDADIVPDMLYILQFKNIPQPLQSLARFFESQHFAEVPFLRLSARLFSAFKKRVRGRVFEPKECA